MIVSTPRRLNFLCLVSFDGIPGLYNCNTKVSSGSQMVTAKDGESKRRAFSQEVERFFSSRRMLIGLGMMLMLIMQKRGRASGELFLMRWRDFFFKTDAVADIHHNTDYECYY